MRYAPAFPLVLLCFLLSGFAALLYETVWSRQFAFVFGTSELAVATVLAAYMGGLAAGAAVAGGFARRIRRPILAYGVLELGIALAALAVPIAIRASTALCVAAFGGRSAPPEAAGVPLALFYLACSFAILLVPTALMGATLPLLARFAVRRESEIGPRVGVLYATNTAGAVLGTLASAFVLLPRLGLQRTVLVGVGVNGLVFAVATLLARSASAATSAPDSPAAAPRARASASPPPARPNAVAPPARPSATAPPARSSAAAPRARSSGVALPAALERGTLILPLILASGVASFTYEVLWTRLLGHVLGGSVYAFAAMLASFLSGIALGSAVASRLATTPARAARGFSGAQLGIAVLSWLAFLAMDSLPALALRIGAGGGAGLARHVAIAALVLLPAALCIGATFPFAVRILARGDADAGPASARVYAWNTLGAIAGALGSGFLLIPLLGYAGMITAAIALNLALAIGAALLARPASRPRLLAAAFGLVLLALARPTTPWKLVGASPLSLGRTPAKPLYFAVGRSATVALALENDVWKLRINGLPEGMILPAGQNQASVLERWLGALPTLARPRTRSMLVIGLGGGSALEAVSRQVQSIDVIELEPNVIEANRRVSGRRAVDPLVDPRVHLYTNDARGALLLTDERWDAVVSQPSHPWTAGASHLYTREFFGLVRDHLAAGGVFVQWIELAFVDEALLRSLVATLLDVFPNVRMYRPIYRSGVLFVASDQPLPMESVAAGAIAASPDSFAWAGVQTAEDVAAALALDEEGARRFAAGAPLATDDWNLLESRSPAVLAAPLGSAGADRLLASLDPLPALSRDLDRLYLVRRLLADQYPARAAQLVNAMTDPVEKLVGRGLVTLAGGHAGEGTAALHAALRLDPGSAEARVALLRVERDSLLAGKPETLALAEGLADPVTAVLEGWSAESQKNWEGVSVLDARLAAARPHDPIYPDAFRLRAAWRIQTGDRGLAAEALVILDHMLPLSTDQSDRQLRAQAARVARSPRAAAG